jgi:hypothetical protein
MAYAPTLAPLTDAAPTPRVLVTFTTLAPTCQTINVYRVQEGRQYKVRGGVNLFATGGAVVMDYEAGFGVPLTYQAEMLTSAGVSLGFTDTATTTLAVTKSWVHQPLSPALAVPVRVFIGTAAAVMHGTPGETVTPEGASVATRIGGQRLGIQNLPLSFRVNTVADADEFQAMFGSYSTDFPAVVCLRCPPPARLPRTLFLGSAAQSPSTGPVETSQANFTFISYAWTVDEVQPPAPGLVIPALRRKDIDAAFPTRAARAAAYATRLARDSDFSKAGLAGP